MAIFSGERGECFHCHVGFNYTNNAFRNDNLYAVYDDIAVMFAEYPRAGSSFSSVNGDLTVMFPRSLTADLRLKTFNGKIYTDFDASRMAARPPVAERQGGKFIYKIDRSIGLRVGAGGPELGFETLNGDIRIRDWGTR